MDKKDYLFKAGTVTTIVSWIFVATGLAVISSVLFLLASLDHSALEDRSNRVDIAIEIENKFLQTILLEYSYWDEGYEKIIVDRNETFFEENSGTWVIEEYGFDFSLVVGANKQLLFMSTNEKAEGLTFEELLANGLDNYIEESLLSDESSGTVKGNILVDSEVFFVALSPFRDEETGEIRPDSYLVYGRSMDVEYLSALEASYELPGLRLARKEDRGENFKALFDESGKKIGRLTWTEERPSQTMAPRVLIVVIPFIILAIFLTRYFIRHEHVDLIAYQERLYQEATVDLLTGINNRRHLLAIGKHEMITHKRTERQMAIAMIDVDHFKDINDNYGHAIGDKALIHLTKVFCDELRESDIIGRIGGDEFVIVFKETPLIKATEALDRVLKELSKRPLIEENIAITLSISVGLMAMKNHETFESILEDADTALYKAKNNGRNQLSLSI